MLLQKLSTKCLCNILLMRQQSTVTHTICHTEILALQDSLVTNTPSVKNVVSTKICCCLYFHKNITCLSVGPLRICNVFVSCKTVIASIKIAYWKVTTNCCSMSDMHHTCSLQCTRTAVAYVCPSHNTQTICNIHR
jgi:hypothetical protein